MPSSAPPRPPRYGRSRNDDSAMTGEELKTIRASFSAAVGDQLSYLDMAALCGLADPAGNGRDTYRKWEDGNGPSGPVAAYLNLIWDGLCDASPAVPAFFREYIIIRVGITPL